MSVGVEGVTWLEFWAVDWDGLCAISCFHTLEGLFTRVRHHAPESFLFRFVYFVLKVKCIHGTTVKYTKGNRIEKGFNPANVRGRHESNAVAYAWRRVLC